MDWTAEPLLNKEKIERNVSPRADTESNFFGNEVTVEGLEKKAKELMAELPRC
jgi:hypothetical protein